MGIRRIYCTTGTSCINPCNSKGSEISKRSKNVFMSRICLNLAIDITGPYFNDIVTVVFQELKFF